MTNQPHTSTSILTKPKLYQVVILLPTDYTTNDINSIVDVLRLVFHFSYDAAWKGIDKLLDNKEQVVNTLYTREVAETKLEEAYNRLKLDNSSVKCILHRKG